MKNILNKFSDCDTMGLVVYNYHKDLNLKISQEHVDLALSKLRDFYKDYLFNLYKKYSNEYKLISFDNLFNDIFNECREFKNKHSKHNSSKPLCFIVDFVGKSTKYSKPLDFFWHFYHSVEMLIDIENASNEYIGNENVIEVLDNYPELKNNLVNYEVTYNTYSTTGSTVAVVYYFKLNEHTKNFLLQYETDFDLEAPFEDLGLFKNGELKYYSITHEEERIEI